MTASPQSPTKPRHKPRHRALLILVILFVLSVPALIIYLAARPAVPFSKLARLKPGMSREEVHAILGPPQDRVGDDCLIYRRFANPGWVEVYFNQHDKLDHINDESGGIKDLSPPVGR
ncbi:MAG: hypothetical protein U0903_12560 [Planctomycetales bacterium]